MLLAVAAAFPCTINLLGDIHHGKEAKYRHDYIQ